MKTFPSYEQEFCVEEKMGNKISFATFVYIFCAVNDIVSS